MHLMIGENLIIRLKPCLTLLGVIAAVVLLHMKLIPASESTKDVISLVCYVLVALNNPIASQIQDRERNFLGVTKP